MRLEGVAVLGVGMCRFGVHKDATLTDAQFANVEQRVHDRTQHVRCADRRGRRASVLTV